jgi:uncharacterized metal-binding protein
VGSLLSRLPAYPGSLLYASALNGAPCQQLATDMTAMLEGKKLHFEFELAQLVYACSGCSSAAQLANHVALQLDRRGVAEMSCIAGVGGDVRYLLKIAQSGRAIVALDGCPLACVKSCLARHGLTANRHYQLQQ